MTMQKTVAALPGLAGGLSPHSTLWGESAVQFTCKKIYTYIFLFILFFVLGGVWALVHVVGALAMLTLASPCIYLHGTASHLPHWWLHNIQMVLFASSAYVYVGVCMCK